MNLMAMHQLWNWMRLDSHQLEPRKELVAKYTLFITKVSTFAINITSGVI